MCASFHSSFLRVSSNLFALPAQMESACVTIHEALKTVIDSQKHYRLREAQDRARAEDLNSRVSYWSIGETIALFVVSFSQVLLLRNCCVIFKNS